VSEIPGLTGGEVEVTSRWLLPS